MVNLKKDEKPETLQVLPSFSVRPPLISCYHVSGQHCQTPDYISSSFSLYP